jgi:RNA polymerase sigma factor
MGMLPFGRKRSHDLAELADLLEKSQAGDELAREILIKKYRPFLLRVCSQVSRRYIHPGADDEFSIALLAFNEAIDGFDLSKTSFLAFAETVIRRRLIDYFRSQNAQSKGTPWTDFDVVDEEDNVTNYAEISSSVRAYNAEEEQVRRKYVLALEEFGIGIADLVKVSPKHRDARASGIEVARLIVSDSELLRYVRDKHSLPLKLLEDRVRLSRKTLERQRKYILAMVVLFVGEYRMLQDYLRD